MKIGLVLSKPPGYSETFFRSKIKGLINAGFEVVLFVQETSLEFSLSKVVTSPRKDSNKVLNLWSVLYALFKLLWNFNRLNRFLKLEKQSGRNFIRAFKNSINNSHLITYKKLDWLHFGFATMALGSENVAQTIGAKMSVSLRGFDVAIYPIKHKNVYQLLWERVDKVHSISNDLLELAYQLGYSKNKPVAIINPAIDTTLFRYEKKRKQKKINKLNFLTVARLHWKKGLVDTLEALAILKSKGINFDYTIIGLGEEESLLRFSILQLNLLDKVSLVGKKTPLEVLNYMKTCNIYLQYSISEGFCNAVLEAQAMGCLCIVSDAEGLSENVLHNKTGWVVPKQKPKELANKIEEVINLPKEEKYKISKQARDRVIQDFNLEKQNKEYIEFYTQ